MQPTIPYDLSVNLIRIKSSLKWYKARWLLVLIFVSGYIAIYPVFKSNMLEFLTLTIISIYACSLLLSCLKPPLINKLPIWIILGVFMVAYYLKFYLMVLNPEIMPLGFLRQFYWMINSPEILLETYATMTYSFVTFCLTAWVLLVYTKTTQTHSFKREIKYKRLNTILMWLIIPLMVVTAVVMYITGISRMGADSVYLPFRLAGWIVNIRRILIPALLLLLIWCSDKAGSRKYLIIGILLLFVHGLSDMLLRSSRGALLGMFIKLTILFIVTGRINKQRMRLFVIILLVTILLWPVISVYREIRSGISTVSINSSLSKAIGDISLFDLVSLPEMLSEASKSVFSRFTGVNILLTIIGSAFQPLWTSVFNISVAKFVTVEIFGFPPDAPMGVAPSLLGWFYIVGGKYLAVFGMFCIVFFTCLVWRVLSRARLRCLPVAQVLFLSWIISIFSEGALDAQYITVLVMIGSVAVCEWIVHTFGRTFPATLKYREQINETIIAQ